MTISADDPDSRRWSVPRGRPAHQLLPALTRTMRVVASVAVGEPDPEPAASAAFDDAVRAEAARTAERLLDTTPVPV